MKKEERTRGRKEKFFLFFTPPCRVVGWGWALEKESKRMVRVVRVVQVGAIRP